MLSPLSPQPSLPSPTFTPLPSPSPSSQGQRVRTSSRRNKSVSVSLARAFLSLGVTGEATSTLLEDSAAGGSDSSGGFSRSGTGYGDGSVGGSSSRSRRTKRRHLELSEGDTIQIGQPIPTTSSSAPLQAVRSSPLPSSPPPSSSTSTSTESEPGLNRLEIVRQLGTGSYAVVYLVREVLDQPTGRKRSDSGSELEWDMEGEDGIVGLGTGKGRCYGREFALKCLSKQDLSEESLEVQMFEATIHQSLPYHANIVTLYQTLQTPEWLFLVLELCPGEDLFYWLERSKPPPTATSFNSSVMSTINGSPSNGTTTPPSPALSALNPHHGSAPHTSHFPFSANRSLALSITPQPGLPTPSSSLLLSSINTTAFTPPTPSLLSAIPAPLLLAPHRVRLISSMFAQMCAAVQACHDSGVSHRDIKPENIIITEEKSWSKGRGRVVCKLTDFGLATTETDCEDVECGSRPYMAVECRNNLGPSYRPPPADVWSLGIVLINMLFHKNPWSDPSPTCAPFQSFRADPKGFLAAKFPGMGPEVASFLAEKVLAWDPETRVSAGEFGKWVGGLGSMLGGNKKIALPTGGGGGGGRKPPVRTAFHVEKKKVEPFKTTSSTLFAKSPVLPRASFGDSFNSEIRTSPPSLVSALTTSAPTTAPTTPVFASSIPTSPDFLSDFDKSSPPPLIHSQPALLPLSPPAFGRRDSIHTEAATTDAETDDATDFNEDGEPWSRSASGTSKRKKRGARKGKAALLASTGSVAVVVVPSSPVSSSPSLTIIDAAPLPPPAAAETGLAGLSSGLGNPEITARALALASQTLARQISAIPRPPRSNGSNVCHAPAGYEYRGSSPYPPSLPNGAKSPSVPSSPGSGSTTRTPSSTRKSTELESLRALAREREEAAAAMGLGKEALSPWPRGRPSERDPSPSDSIPREPSRRRGLSPSNSISSSVHSNQSHRSHASGHHASDSASWRQPPGSSPQQSPNPSMPNLLGSNSAPAAPTRRDAGSGAAPGTRRILTARRPNELVPNRAEDPSPGRASARTSISASPPSSIYSRASDSSVSTYATTASSSGSFQPNSSRGSSLVSAGGTPVQPKRQTNVKRESLPSLFPSSLNN
ncbi:hypothetical protein BDY24DRAFT_120511 [Mrakia frigida]|uniref:uncharacterized protein n=1 Tax=Mrakia frigida TaxID=29902 RepID=UPI003FCC066D